jgi:hypothetical protein
MNLLSGGALRVSVNPSCQCLAPECRRGAHSRLYITPPAAVIKRRHVPGNGGAPVVDLPAALLVCHGRPFARLQPDTGFPVQT